MRRIGVNQSPQGGTWYPFTQEGPLPDFILDSFLHLPPSYRSLSFPVQLHVNGSESSFTVQWSNSSGTIWSVSSSTAVISNWGDLRVATWTDVNSGMTASIVYRTGAFASGNQDLDPRTIFVAPKHVRSLKVGTQSFKGTTVLSAGNNVRLENEVVEEGPRRSSRIVIHGEPGAGAGKIEGCSDQELAVRFINGIGPSNYGNFRLSGHECSQVKVPAYVDTDPLPEAIIPPANLQLLDGCWTCYPCWAFVNVYRAILRTDQKFRNLASRAEYVRNLHVNNIERWQKERECRSKNTLKVRITPQEERNFTIGVSWCNVTGCCIEDFEIRLSIQLFSGSTNVTLLPDWYGLQKKSLVRGSFSKGEEIPQDPLWIYSDRVYPIARYFFPYASPQDLTTIRLLWMLSGPNLPDMSIRVWATVHFADQGGPDCGIPSPIDPVPTDLSQLWNAVFTGWTGAKPLRYVAHQTTAVNSSRGRFFR